jgi:acyl-CoA synthetase (AMP-forming)/AMP-acid ligase II
VGAARSLREQALPLGFRAQGAALNSLAVGQPVRVFVQTKQKVKGIAVPVASLMKNPANQTVVWVKTAPERFEPRSITTEAPRRCERRGHVGPEGRGPRRHARRHPDQPGALTCSSGYSTTA